MMRGGGKDFMVMNPVRSLSDSPTQNKSTAFSRW
jgi:hypothetical protein